MPITIFFLKSSQKCLQKLSILRLKKCSFWGLIGHKKKYPKKIWNPIYTRKGTPFLYRLRGGPGYPGGGLWNLISKDKKRDEFTPLLCVAADMHR